MKNPFSRRIRKAFTISIVALSLCCAASLITLKLAKEKEGWVQHTYLVIDRLEFLLSVMKDAETGTRGYIITRKPETLMPYNNAAAACYKILSDIKTLTRDNPNQQATLGSLRSNIDNQFKILAFYINETKLGHNVSAAKISEGKQVMDEARALVKQMKEREYTLLQNRDNGWRKLYTFVVVFIILLSVLGVVSARYFCHTLLTNYFEKVKFRRKIQQQSIMIGNRIRIMQALTAQIAAGNYDIQITGHEKDALGILAEDINRMTNALDKSFKQLNELMNRKDEFINITAHEFRTPLTSIQATLQLLTRVKSDETQIKIIGPFIDKANNQVRRLTVMLKDLLDVSKINSNQLVLNMVNFSLTEAVEESIHEIQAGDISQTIQLNAAGTFPVTADKSKIIRVFTNLLSNAVKYSDPGSTIQVNISADEQAVKVEVEDEGKGIPPEKLSFVFDRYFRVEETSQNFSGLGLGLYISRQIIEKHNGTIGADSIVGKGTTFWFTLPLSNAVV